MSTIPQYEELMRWSNDELFIGNRVKASKVNKAALKMKSLYDKQQTKDFLFYIHKFY